MAPTATSFSATGAAGGTAATAASASNANATANSSSTTTTTSSNPPPPTSLEEANQRYQSTKLALRTGLANKRIIDRSLIDLESQIYLFEGSYLQSTSTSGGNIVKGFDSYLKNSSSSTSSSRGGNNSNNAANLADIPLEDRIFSLSSATYQKSLELKANEGLEQLEEKDSSANNTPKASKKDSGSTAAGGSGGGEDTPVAKKSKKDKDSTSASANTPGGSGGGGGGKEGSVVKKKKLAAIDKDGSAFTSTTGAGHETSGKNSNKDKERSSTPNLKSGGGKSSAGDAGSASGTPTKGQVAGKAPSTATKLKRKNTDGPAAATGGKAGTKKKKDDD